MYVALEEPFSFSIDDASKSLLSWHLSRLTTAVSVFLLQDVERLLVMKGTDPAVRKKAALCFLRFFRENPGNLVHSELADKMVRHTCLLHI